MPRTHDSDGSVRLAAPLIRKVGNAHSLTDDDHTALSQLCRSGRTVEAGTAIIEHGDAPSDVHLVLEGVAFRYKLLPNGSRQIVGLLLPGDFCNLHIAILGAMDYSIATLTICTIANVAETEINAVMQAHPRIARALWWAMLVDEGILREWLTSVGRREAIQRMAHFFCEILLRLQAAGLAADNRFAFPLTQVDLADVLGLTNVHVNRMLQELRAAGLIVMKSRVVEIPDPERLQAFCNFDPTYLHLAEPAETKVRQYHPSRSPSAQRR